MKKIFSLLLAFIIIILSLVTLVSCKSKTEVPSVTPETTVEDEKPKEPDNTTKVQIPDDSSDIEEIPEITPCPWEDESLPISYAIVNEIQTACLIRNFGEDYDRLGYMPEHVWLVCYGIFDNAYAVMVWVPDIGYMDVVTTVEVGSYKFIFGDSNTMTVYCDGDFYSLPMAYENGILNDAQLGELYNYYIEAHYDGVAPN